MSLEQFLNKLHEEMPKMSFTSIRSLNEDSDPLVVVANAYTAAFVASFKFDSEENTVYYYTFSGYAESIRQLLNAIDKVLDGVKL